MKTVISIKFQGGIEILQYNFDKKFQRLDIIFKKNLRIFSKNLLYQIQ